MKCNCFEFPEKNVHQKVEKMKEVVPLDLEFVAFVRLYCFGQKYILYCFLFFFLFSVSLACGGSASENSTYIVQASATAVSSPCTYTICPCSTNICRIRFDLTVKSSPNNYTVAESTTIVHYWKLSVCALFKMFLEAFMIWLFTI